MATLHNSNSEYGRLIPKPETNEPQEENFDEVAVPIQDQIENLTLKIALKQRYNRVLTEEFEETSRGAGNILRELLWETRELRFQLLFALTSETTAVQHALRTYRTFQLALTDRNTSQAIPWLEDKLSDSIKRLNRFLYSLKLKRRCLEDSEQLVILMEKWPRPGTLPWELMALDKFEELENTIEEIRIKGETMTLLHSKYNEIKFILTAERGKYAPTLLAQETNLGNLRSEMNSLQRMLDEAYYFREESYQSLALTEKESSENRKERRRLMTRTKKKVESTLKHAHQNRPKVSEVASHTRRSLLYGSLKVDEDDVLNKMEKSIVAKRELAARQELRARRLVDIMRVNDLTFIPARLKMVTELGEYLVAQLEMKEQWRDVLIKQRQQLNLLFCHFRYTGELREEQFKKTRDALLLDLENVKHNKTLVRRRRFFYGDIFTDLGLTSLAIMEQLKEPRQRYTGNRKTRVLKSDLKRILLSVKKLAKTLEDYEQTFADRMEERQYGSFVRMPVVPPRLIRIDIEPAVEEDFDDDELPDLKVPNRQDIKVKGIRFIQQQILKRGLH